MDAAAGQPAAAGITFKVTDRGETIGALEAPDRDGVMGGVVLGLDALVSEGWGDGYDHNLWLAGAIGEVRDVAVLHDPVSNRSMRPTACTGPVGPPSSSHRGCGPSGAGWRGPVRSGIVRRLRGCSSAG